MTTSASTPLTCRSAQLRRSMGRAPPFTGRMSIGVVRSNTRLLAWVSVNITFRTVLARASAALGTRLGIYRCNRPRGLRAGFLSCPQCLCDRWHCEIIRPRVFADCRSESPSVCNRVVNVVGRPNTSFGPRRGCLRRDSHGDRNIGEAQRREEESPARGEEHRLGGVSRDRSDRDRASVRRELRPNRHRHWQSRSATRTARGESGLPF